MLALLAFRRLPGEKPVHSPWPFVCRTVRNEDTDDEESNFPVFYQKPIAFFPKKWIKRVGKNIDEESNFPVFYQKPIAFYPRKWVKRVQKNSDPAFPIKPLSYYLYNYLLKTGRLYPRYTIPVYRKLI